MSPSTNVTQVGLVGCGYWGSKHVRVLNELPTANFAGLCDKSAENVARLPRYALPPLVTASYDELLDSDVEAVIIATPASSHFDLAAKALRAGKHVLIEKPFTTRSSDALKLIDLADERGLTLAVGHTYVYHPAIQYIRHLVESGALGDLFYIHSARLNFGLLQPDIDVIWDLAPHDVSILTYILGTRPLAAAARGVNYVGKNLSEVAHLDLEFLGGPTGHIYLSWLEPTKVRRFTIVGSERTVVYDDVATAEHIRIYERGIQVPSADAERWSPSYHLGGLVVPQLGNDEPLRREDEHFLHCIRTGEQCRTDGRSGLEVVSVLEAATRSLRTGGGTQLVEAELGSPRQRQARQSEVASALGLEPTHAASV